MGRCGLTKTLRGVHGYTWFDQHYISDCGAYMKEEQERKEKAKGEAGEGSAVRS